MVWLFVKCQNSEPSASNSSGSEPVVFGNQELRIRLEKAAHKKKFLKIILAFRRIKLGRKNGAVV